MAKLLILLMPKILCFPVLAYWDALGNARNAKSPELYQRFQ